MAKIDVSKIDGYNTMTPEEKLAALEGFEFEDNSSDEVERYKKAASKANSEAAEWKRKHTALLTEEEQKKQAAEEELNNLRAEVETMRKEKLMAGHKAQFLALGYEASLADDTAKALVEGNIDKVFANQKKFLESHDKTLKADLLKDTPTPPAGEGGETMTLEKLKAMTSKERYEYSVSHPEEYTKIYGGNV